MRWAIFCICLCTLLLNTGLPAFAKSRNVCDNTRTKASKAYLLVQQNQRQQRHIGNAVDQQLTERLICTNDEEDDLPVSAPVRKQLQSILAYFLSAYLAQIDDELANGWYLAEAQYPPALNRNQLCVFRI
jgi:hypothetical protein